MALYLCKVWLTFEFIKKKSKIAPNHFWQRNRLKAVHTLQSTLYTVHYEQYIPELSTAETSKERGLM